MGTSCSGCNGSACCSQPHSVHRTEMSAPPTERQEDDPLPDPYLIQGEIDLSGRRPTPNIPVAAADEMATPPSTPDGGKCSMQLGAASQHVELSVKLIERLHQHAAATA
mmetsp:Transcript_110474/g.330481  ORF Transcript_110474/g.330481 Transcript_110474/m.330481 type:complete len:109 (+) Transcript_110474:90-416(+)